MLTKIAAMQLSHPSIWIFVRVLIIIAVTALAIKVTKFIFKEIIKHNEIHIKLIKNIITACIYLAGALGCIQAIPGLPDVMSTILAGSGIAAIIIGLAAQESLGNLISGMFISMFRPFEVGDRINLMESNITGTIEDITLRHTVLKTFTNSRVIIPNSSMNKAIIENSHIIDEKSSSFVDVQVSYECNIREAMDLMATVISSHPSFIDTRTPEEIASGVPSVQVFVRDLGKSGIDLRASMWTPTIEKNFEACSDVRLRIVESFRLAGIEIPYSKVVVLDNR